MFRLFYFIDSKFYYALVSRYKKNFIGEQNDFWTGSITSIRHEFGSE